MLYESMTEISNAKNLEDKFQVESVRKDKLIRNLNVEKEELHENLTLTISDRDVIRSDNKEMADHKMKADKEKTRFAIKVKTDTNRFNDDIRRLNTELNITSDNLTKANQTVK
jgi:hypothetical protein